MMCAENDERLEQTVACCFRARSSRIYKSSQDLDFFFPIPHDSTDLPKHRFRLSMDFGREPFFTQNGIFKLAWPCLGDSLPAFLH
jgi:hypothetical protein